MTSTLAAAASGDPSDATIIDKPKFWNPWDECLPSGCDIAPLPMRARAQQALVAASQADSDLAIHNGFTDFMLLCIERLGGAAATRDSIMALEEHDRRAALLMIRRRSFKDPVASFVWDCLPPVMPRGGFCSHRGNVHGADLEKFEIRPLPVVTPGKLPSSSFTFSYAPVTGNTTPLYIRERRVPAGKVDTIALMRARRVTLDGKLASREQLEDLIAEDAGAIRKALGQWGGPDSRVEAVCDNCGRVLKSFAEGLPGFFLEAEAE